MSNVVPTPRAISHAMLALAAGLLLAACDGGADRAAASGTPGDAPAQAGAAVADSAQVPASIEDNPCELAPAEMVAGLFDVPVAELERESSMSSACVYSWESADETRALDARVSVNSVSEDAGSAATNFRAVTRGMSGADLDQVKADMKADAAAELDSRGERNAVDAIVGSSSGSAGIQFEDVEGVGDEARFALTVGAGDLHVRVGNLYFTTSAYSGEGMPMPEKLTGGAIMAANKQWRQDTMPQRKDAAIKLAKAIVEAL